MLAFLDRRVKSDRLAHPDHLADKDTMGILALQELKDDPDPLDTLDLLAQLDLQDLQVHQEWV